MPVIHINEYRNLKPTENHSWNSEYPDNIVYFEDYTANRTPSYLNKAIELLLDSYEPELGELMPLSESVYLEIDGEITDGFDYGISNDGKIYKLLSISRALIAVHESNAIILTPDEPDSRFDYTNTKEYYCISGKNANRFIYDIGF